jgi:hypothetical protein
MSENLETYTTKECLCENCDFSGDVEIRKGVKINDAACSNCGIVGGLYKKPQTSTYYKF